MTRSSSLVRAPVLAACVALLLSAWAPAVGAQPAPRKKVLRLEDITVEGRIQKPQAFYILPRQNLNWQGLERNDSFLPKISKALEEDPF